MQTIVKLLGGYIPHSLGFGTPGFNRHPGLVVAFLDKTLYNDYLCLVASNKLQICLRISQTSTGKLGKWSTPKRMRNRPKHSAPSLSRDRRIKMHQSIKTSLRLTLSIANTQRWSRGHKARGQGQGHKKNPRPRPRTAFPRTDTLEAKDRNARGQGQGPRTQSASALQKKKKRSSQKFFRRSPKKKKKKKKKGLHKNFSSDLHEKTLSKKFFNRFTKF